MIGKQDPVRAPAECIEEMAEHWPLIDALMGGTHEMRKAGKTFLPKWPREDEDDYKWRLGVATLFPAYERTVSVLTGKPFSKPVTIADDVPARIRGWLDDCDLEGRNIDAFAAAVMADAMAWGLAGILVDCPPNPGARSVEEERKAGIRPYLIHIRAKQILGWKAAKQGSQRVLTQLRLLECVEDDAGEFETKSVEQVRVLEPGRWRVYREQKNAATGEAKWVLHEEGTTTLKVIPFVPVYGRQCGFMIGLPPMLELAYANCEHWQTKSDQQTILHVARVPLLFASGLGDTDIVIGPNSLVKAADPQAKLAWVEHSGAAIDAGRLSILDLEDRMRQIGAELLVIKPGNTTVAQTIADNEPGMCDLQRITLAVEDSLDRALDLMAAWVKEADGGHVSLYRDFGAATLAEASAELLSAMQARGALSHETLLNELLRRGILSPDVKVAEEAARAKAEAPKPAETKPPLAA